MVGACDFRLLVLYGLKTDGAITVGLRGVKITFCPEIGASTSWSVAGTCGVRQSKLAQAARQKVCVVFVGHNLDQVERRRHVWCSSVGACTSCRTEGACNVSPVRACTSYSIDGTEHASRDHTHTHTHTHTHNARGIE